MADYNKVQIENIFLTDTGLVGGLPCRAQVSGLDRLQISYAGNTVKAADNTPYNFAIEHLGKGIDIEIRPFVVTETVLNDVNAVIDAAILGGTTITLGITEGPFGDFSLECLPLFPRPVEFSGEFSDDRISDAVFRFTAVSINP